MKKNAAESFLGGIFCVFFSDFRLNLQPIRHYCLETYNWQYPEV